MANDKVRHDCSERVYRGGSFRGSPCSKPGKVERPVTRTVYPPAEKLYDEATFQFTEVPVKSYQVEEPKWFCGTHDPVVLAERDQKRRAEQRAEWAAKQERDRAYRNITELMTKRRQDVIDAARELVAAKFEADHPAFEKLENAVDALEAK